MDESVLAELRQFLSAETRADVQLSALNMFLSLSADGEFQQQFSACATSDALIDDLCRLIDVPQTDKCLLLAVSINLSGQSPQSAAKFAQSDLLVGQCFKEVISRTPAGKQSIRAAQLLSNLSRFVPDKLHQRLLSHDIGFMRGIFERFSSFPTEQEHEGMESTATYLGHDVPLVRRLAALDVIYNLSMDDVLHELLLRDENALLSSLLWPIVDAEDRLEEVEMGRLPIQLQYWERRREQEPAVREKVLRTLYQLCATRSGRECLRRKGVYALLRELDRTTATSSSNSIAEGRLCTFYGTEEPRGMETKESGDYFGILRALIGVLIRTEEEMGTPADEFSIRQLGVEEDQVASK